MKQKALILVMVMVLAAMGPRPDSDRTGSRSQESSFQRGTIGAETAAPVARDGVELRVLPAAEATPDEFLWQARPVVIFADTAADPAFTEQLRVLTADPAPLLARDVVVVTDVDPSANSVWRRQLRPEGFSLVLMDKDGQVKQRKPAPWSVREITRAIDKFPLRLQEIGRAGVLP